MKDHLDGATKIKTIMGKTTFKCRQCGMAFTHKREADAHCSKQKPKFNKNRYLFDRIYSTLTGRS